MGLLLWAAIFFAIAVVAGLFGFTGIAAGSADIAKILFYIFIAIFIVIFISAFIIV